MRINKDSYEYGFIDGYDKGIKDTLEAIIIAIVTTFIITILIALTLMRYSNG